MKANRAASLEYSLAEYPGYTELQFESMWNWLRCDLLPDGLDYFVCDTAISCGSDHAARWARLIAGTHGLDMDLDTVARLTEIGSEPATNGIEFFRRRRFRTDPGWSQHGTAWSNRVNRAKRRALKMIREPEAAKGIAA